MLTESRPKYLLSSTLEEPRPGDQHRLVTIDGQTSTVKPINSPAQVLFASLIGTTIEFFDFYIYAAAAVLVFPRLFFSADPASLTAFVTFYLMTVFTLSWGTSALGYSREKFLDMQLFAILFFALFTPISAVLAERCRRRMLIWVNVALFLFGLVLAPMFAAGTTGAVLMMVLGMTLVGLVYGPLGTVLSELFPTTVRYSGSSLTYNLGGIFGASLAPYAATYLAKTYGLQYVGYYLSSAAILSLAGLLATRETKDAIL